MERNDTPEGKEKHLELVKKIDYYMREGLNQKTMAALIGVSPKTIWSVCKLYPQYFNKVKQAARGEIEHKK